MMGLGESCLFAFSWPRQDGEDVRRKRDGHPPTLKDGRTVTWCLEALPLLAPRVGIPLVILVDPARFDVEMMLTGGELRCPDCAGVLRPWGHARERVIRQLRGVLARIRPRRSSCRACRRTHVLLPVSVLPRRGNCAETIGAALTAKACGVGFRPIAASLGVPEATVLGAPPKRGDGGGWLRRFNTNARRWRVFFTRLAVDLDPEPEPISAHESVFADAVEVIGVAAAAAVRRFGPRPAWQFVAAATAGQFLSPHPSLG